MAHNPTGSQWHRWDLHFHTPSSFDYGNGSVTDEQIIDCLKEEFIRVVAITDHHTMDVSRIRNLKELAGDDITVLPGIELRSDQGGKPIHYIAIFSEDCSLDHIWDTLKGKLELTPESIAEKGGDDRIYVPLEKAAEVTRQLGGVISIHAGTKSNSINEISNAEEFQQQIKADITRQFVDIYEVGKDQDISVHFDKIFPAIGKELPLIICSDNHNAKEYRTKTPLWMRADPCFRGLKMVIHEPLERVFLGEFPESPARVTKHPTKYIRGIAFQAMAGCPAGEKWFSGGVDFNHGLVAIIGNKGSGKSALADTIGLLGASTNSARYSFLSAKRFRHPQSGRAKHFNASITWESGECYEKCLGDDCLATDVPHVQYLPQEHVENVCNELGSGKGSKFEEELKAVIFSHVPDVERHGQPTLDALLEFHAGKKRERIDTLQRDLKKLTRERCALEAQADPSVRTELEKKLDLQQQVLAGHDAKKPEVVEPPAEGESDPESNELAARIHQAEADRDKLSAEVDKLAKSLSDTQTRRVVADRLLEALENLEVDVRTAKDGMLVDANALGVDLDTIVTFAVNREPITAIRDKCVQDAAQHSKDLDGASDEEAEQKGVLGARARLAEAKKKVEKLQNKLDEPNRQYQKYLKALKEWQDEKARLEGTAEFPESIKGLTATIESLKSLPAKIRSKQEAMLAKAREIYEVKEELASLYRTLYEPVQSFMATNDLAKGKLQFRVEFATSDFAARFLQMIAKNKRGTFKGVDEGYTRITEMLSTASWEDADSAMQFVAEVDEALHKNLQGDSEAVTLVSQIAKEHSASDLLNYLYGIEYLEPRYLLKWDEKDLAMLSPGERGTVLLVFYLLIDKTDVPLIIDQPEGNLDNHTVAKILVDCIRETRKRRQVFIVTHNPNLAVVCDADQVVHATLDKEDGNAITYSSGALENPAISKFVTDVLEGTMWAFDIRGYKYAVGMDRTAT